ncbi:MAG: hypothetical protein MJ206_03545 [Bacilli bacterium]|nr:hypothetical protein [Bacilli bacterium]
MIKKLGQLVMFLVAAAFIGYSIYKLVDIIPTIQQQFSGGLKEIFEKLIQGDWSGFAKVWEAGWRILYILVGLSALAIAISGRTGFWTTITAIIMLAFFIMNVVNHVKAGDWKDYLTTLPVDIILQVAYVGGVLLVKIGRHTAKE